MKLINQTKLFFKEGNSDKVYEIDLCEVGNNQFLVNFRYGKRGGTLKEGTKTPSSVTLLAAQTLYNGLEIEKRKKGYQSEAEMFQAMPTLVISTNKPASREEAILRRLQAAVDGKADENTHTWKTSRVIWRAGELRLQTATPFIIRLTDRGDEMQRYSSLWALGRIADASAVTTLNIYFGNQKYSELTRRIAGESLLHILQGEERQKHLTYYLNRLPDALKSCVLNGNVAELTQKLQDRIIQTHSNYEYIEYLYSLAIDYPKIKKSLVPALAEMPFKPNYFKPLRHIFKIAVLRDDAEIIGLLAYRFERENALFQSKDKGLKAVHIDGQRIVPKTELKKENSRLAFSDKTRHYFNQFSQKILIEAGSEGSLFYVRLATAMLLSYSEKDYKKGYSAYEWRYENRQHKQYETQRYVDCFDAHLLNHILIGGNNQQYKCINYGWYEDVKSNIPVNNTHQNTTVVNHLLDKIRGFFTKKETKVQEDTEAKTIERPELFPELWDKLPQAYIQLLMQAKLDKIHEFALINLKNHPDYEALVARIDMKMIQQLLRSKYQIPAYFGLQIAKNRLETMEIDADFAVDLIESPLREAWELGKAFFEKNVDLFTNNPALLCKVIFSCYEEVRFWIKKILEENPLNDTQQQALFGHAIATILAMQGNETLDNRIVKQVRYMLLSLYLERAKQVSFEVIRDLLKHSLLQANKMGALLITAKNLTIKELPNDIATILITSEKQELRKEGQVLLHNIADETAEAHLEQLITYYNSPFKEIQTVTKDILLHLSRKNNENAAKIVNALVPLLMRKETYEGAHTEFGNFLSHELIAHLGVLDKTTALRLLYARYVPAQNLGVVLLQKYINPQDLTIRQIIAVGNHEILAARELCQQWFEAQIGRMRYEREEALRLLDAKWDDTRAFAIAYFRKYFTASDWTPPLLVSIADSVRPDIQAFGRELIARFFEEGQGDQYLLQLSQHPSADVQLFATNYLERYAVDNLPRLQALEHYFRSVLMRVNKGRVAKDRVMNFLYQEALKSEPVAQFVATIFTDISATTAIMDKAKYIEMMRDLKEKYEHLALPIKMVFV